MSSLRAIAGDLLRVARPRECNSATNRPEHATARATGAQQAGLKALALLALGRNNQRNNSAQPGEETAQQQPEKHPPAVALIEQPQSRNKAAETEPPLLRALESGKPRGNAACSPVDAGLLRVARARECNSATTDPEPMRAVVKWRSPTTPAGTWATALGAPGLTRQQVVDQLLARWPDSEVLP